MSYGPPLVSIWRMCAPRRGGLHAHNEVSLAPLGSPAKRKRRRSVKRFYLLHVRSLSELKPGDLILPAVLQVDCNRSRAVIRCELTYVSTAGRQLIFGELLGGWIVLGNHIRIQHVDPDVVVAVDHHSVGTAILIRHRNLRYLMGSRIDSCDLIRAI